MRWPPEAKERLAHKRRGHSRCDGLETRTPVPAAPCEKASVGGAKITGATAASTHGLQAEACVRELDICKNEPPDTAASRKPEFARLVERSDLLYQMT
jgi:hypothetical protein